MKSLIFLSSSLFLKLKRITRLFFLLMIFFMSFYSNSALSDNLYYLCGPDEDGCYEGIYQYCACIPQNPIQFNTPFCFDFDKRTCKPISEVKDCDTHFVFQDQATCLAVMFQSTPKPPCLLTTEAFCREHQSYLCEADGYPSSCHK